MSEEHSVFMYYRRLERIFGIPLNRWETEPPRVQKTENQPAKMEQIRAVFSEDETEDSVFQHAAAA